VQIGSPRVGGLVLTNCDAFENFPPKMFVPLFLLARQRAAVWAVLQQVRLTAVRHSPIGFGPLLRRPRSKHLTRNWVQPALDDPAIRHDITRFARGVKRTELLEAATWLGGFDLPARIVWGTRDRWFTLATAQRLTAALPHAELIEVDDATTFVPIDRPIPVAEAIAAITMPKPA
jgi:pimeloyl-ACP methyl ester carboxylesterase